MAAGLAIGAAASDDMSYSAGFWKEWMAYTTGARLMSDGRDLRGRFDLAHLAALSFTCFAQRALKMPISQRGKKCERRQKVWFYQQIPRLIPTPKQVFTVASTWLLADCGTITEKPHVLSLAGKLISTDWLIDCCWLTNSLPRFSTQSYSRFSNSDAGKERGECRNRCNESKEEQNWFQHSDS